jgi:hypothetical protein
MESMTTKPACGEADAPLFDNWFDPIEAGLRAKVSGFMEALIEEELTVPVDLVRPSWRLATRYVPTDTDRGQGLRRGRPAPGRVHRLTVSRHLH